MPPTKSAPATPKPPVPAQSFNAATAGANFSGLYGDALNAALTASPNLTNTNINALNSVAGNNLALQQQQAPGLASAALSSLNTLDPNAVGLRQQLEGSASQQLGLGTSLDPAYEAQVNQAIRGAQAARGNTLGNAASNAEALNLGQAGLAMQQQRQQFATGVAGLGGVGALTSEIPGIGGYGTNGNAAYNGVTPDLGLAGPTYGNSLYGAENQANQTQASEYNSGLGYGASTYATATNAPNPWMQGLGLALGVGGTLAGGALGGPLGAAGGGSLGSTLGSGLGAVNGGSGLSSRMMGGVQY